MELPDAGTRACDSVPKTASCPWGATKLRTSSPIGSAVIKPRLARRDASYR